MGPKLYIVFHFLFHSGVNLAFLRLNVPCWVSLGFSGLNHAWKSLLSVKGLGIIWNVRVTSVRHWFWATTKHQYGGNFSSLVNFPSLQLSAPEFQSLLLEVRWGLLEAVFHKWTFFLRGFGSCKRTAAAWKICISLCDHTLASESGETPPEELGVVSFLCSILDSDLISCSTEVYLKDSEHEAFPFSIICISCYGDSVHEGFDAFPSENFEMSADQPSRQHLNYLFHLFKYWLYSLSDQDST